MCAKGSIMAGWNQTGNSRSTRAPYGTPSAYRSVPPRTAPYRPVAPLRMDPRMRKRVLFPLLIVLLTGRRAPADETQAPQTPPTPREVLRRAIDAQGKLERDSIKDVYLKFRGPVREQGQTATVEREYWFRASDRAFRIRTSPVSARQQTSDRGVLGATFWEKSRGPSRKLSPGNRDDRGVIQQISKERGEFERILRLLLLTRFVDGSSRLTFASPQPVRLEKDEPPEARRILRNRKERTYDAISIERPGEPRLVLYIDREDLTVRKVEQFLPDKPHRIEWIYYFGPYALHKATGIVLPRFFSVHDSLPIDKKTRESSSVASGVLTVRFNEGLPDTVLHPR